MHQQGVIWNWEYTLWISPNLSQQDNSLIAQSTGSLPRALVSSTRNLQTKTTSRSPGICTYGYHHHNHFFLHTFTSIRKPSTGSLNTNIIFEGISSLRYKSKPPLLLFLSDQQGGVKAGIINCPDEKDMLIFVSKLARYQVLL